MKTIVPLLIAVILLAFVAFHYQSQASDLAKDNTTLTGERDVAQFTLGNYTTSVRLFNDIARSTQDEQKQNSLESQATQAVIKAAVANDDCSRRVVPDGAAERLRQHADKIRNSATSTNPGHSTG